MLGVCLAVTTGGMERWCRNDLLHGTGLCVPALQPLVIQNIIRPVQNIATEGQAASRDGEGPVPTKRMFPQVRQQPAHY